MVTNSHQSQIWIYIMLLKWSNAGKGQSNFRPNTSDRIFWMLIREKRRTPIFRCVSFSRTHNVSHSRFQVFTLSRLASLDNICLCMTMYDYVWQCMTNVWLCMTMYNYVWLGMTRYYYVWQCMTMYDCLWLCMTMDDNICLCMTTLCMTVFDYI